MKQRLCFLIQICKSIFFQVLGIEIFSRRYFIAVEVFLTDGSQQRKGNAFGERKIFLLMIFRVLFQKADSLHRTHDIFTHVLFALPRGATGI